MPSDTLSIVFLNTHLMPKIIPVWELNRFKPDERATSIGKATWPNHDVMAYCEVWTNNYHSRIKRGYPGRGYYTFYDKKGKFGSGLMFTAKRRFKKSHLLHFKEKGSGADALVSKGAMHIRIGTDHSDVDLYVTHLQAGSGDKKQKERLKQLVELVKFVKDTSSKTTPTIILGDLNINGMKKTQDYKDMVACLRTFGPLVDANLLNGGKAHATTFDSKTFGWGKSRLDYAFISDPSVPLPKNPSVLDLKRFKAEAYQCDPKLGYCTAPLHKDPPKCTLSDHAGVELKLSWKAS